MAKFQQQGSGLSDIGAFQDRNKLGTHGPTEMPSSVTSACFVARTSTQTSPLTLANVRE